MDAYNDPNHPANSAKYHTGKACITAECDKPAGTSWSPHWCQACNAARLTRITRNLEGAVRGGSTSDLLTTLKQLGATARLHRPLTVEPPGD